MGKVKILTRNELCELMNIKPATMRKNISRGLLHESSQGEINVFNIKNQQWIVDYCDKKGINYKMIFIKSDNPRSKKKKTTVQKILVDEMLSSTKDESIDKEVDSQITEHTKQRDYKLKKEIELKEIDTKLKQIELDKKKAKVVPTDFMIEIFNIYLKGNINGILNEGNTLIEKLIDELEGSYEMKLNYKKSFKTLINEVFIKNHNSLSEEILIKAKDYSINRNW